MWVYESVCYLDSFAIPQEARVEIQETERHRNDNSQDFYFGTEIDAMLQEGSKSTDEQSKVKIPLMSRCSRFKSGYL